MGSGQAILTYLEDAGRTWLGWSREPAERVLAEADWSPDQPADYCPRCGDSTGPGEATAGGCGTCRRGGTIGDGVVRLGPYVEPLRTWMLDVKYQQWAAMGEALGRRLGQSVLAAGDAGGVDRDRAVVIPMPMPWIRRVYRGIDHSRVLAGGVADRLGAPVAAVLGRANGVPQSVRVASERPRRAGRGMRIRRRVGGWPIEGMDVVLVDDVRTTGATLRAAVRLLRRLKPRQVVCAVAAVADSASRRARGPSGSGAGVGSDGGRGAAGVGGSV